MKYFSAILTLIFLNLAALTLVLYYGNKAKIIEEENKLISLDIKKNQEQLKINEVEFSLYHNYIFLKKLQKIYFKVENENKLTNSRLNLKDFVNQEQKNVFQTISN